MASAGVHEARAARVPPVTPGIIALMSDPLAVPSTMRAVQATALGDPDVLEEVEIAVPELRPDQVLVRVAYASVNFADIKARRGGHHLNRATPYVPGLDASGTVVAVGADVDGLEPGTRVATATDGGSYGEYAAARAALTFPIGDGVDLRAAAGIVAMMTAYNTLLVKARLAEGEVVVIHAATGGVGTLLLQLAKLHGAGRVIAVVGSDTKVELARSYGADDVIVTRGEDLGEQLDAVAPDGVDVVMDSVGGAYFAAGFARLRSFGRIVNFGNAAGDPPDTTMAGMHKKVLSVFGYSSGTYRKLRPSGVHEASTAMLEHLAAGDIEIEIGEVFPLARAADAHRAIESRMSTGKLLLEVAGTA